MSILLKKINKNDNTTLIIDEENLNYNGQSLSTEQLIPKDVYPKISSDNNYYKFNLFFICFKIFCGLLIITLVILFFISIYKINNIENKIENKIENTLLNFINTFNISSIEKLNNNFIDIVNKLTNNSLNNLTISDNPTILNRVLNNNNNITDNVLNFINNNTKIEFWN